jgi:hypothetical protein
VDEASSSSPSSSVTGGGHKKTKLAQNSRGRDAMGFEPFTKETWITESDNPSGDFPLAPSAKTTALKSILLKGFVEAPLDKVSLLLVGPVLLSRTLSLYVEIVKFNIQMSWNIENSHLLTTI